MDSDHELIEALVAGHEPAWREFQRRYGGLLVRCIAQVTRRFPAVSAEDVQEIHAQLLLSLLANDKAKLRAFDRSRGSRFSSYLGMLAAHGAYDWLRSARRQQTFPPSQPTAAFAAPDQAHPPDPFEAAAQKERAELASRILAGFSERDRTFAAMYFGEQMDPHEIARSLNISVKTVYSKKHKIKAKLEWLVADIEGPSRLLPASSRSSVHPPS